MVPVVSPHWRPPSIRVPSRGRPRVGGATSCFFGNASTVCLHTPVRTPVAVVEEATPSSRLGGKPARSAGVTEPRRGQNGSVRRALLLAGIFLLALGSLLAVSSVPPDDGLDHGGNPCSGAIFEVLGIGSRDTNTNVAAGAATTPDKGTIWYCRRAARGRVAVAVIPLALGTAALVVRRRVRSGAATAMSASVG